MSGLETTTHIDPRSDLGTETPHSELDLAVQVFLSQRTQLLRIAHRVTGDIGAAEDVLQEAWIRWQRTDRSAIKNPAAFLTTTTTHLAINVIQSARYRREAPTNTPADSPLAELLDPAEDPVAWAERVAVVEETLWALMTRLSPAELAAYVLRKAFDYPYTDVARLLSTSSVNARQLVRRAQQHLEGDRERAIDPTDHQRLVWAFQAAAHTGDLTLLEGELVRTARPATRRHKRPPVREDHQSPTSRVA